MQRRQRRKKINVENERGLWKDNNFNVRNMYEIYEVIYNGGNNNNGRKLGSLLH